MASSFFYSFQFVFPFFFFFCFVAISSVLRSFDCHKKMINFFVVCVSVCLPSRDHGDGVDVDVDVVDCCSLCDTVGNCQQFLEVAVDVEIISQHYTSVGIVPPSSAPRIQHTFKQTNIHSFTHTLTSLFNQQEQLVVVFTISVQFYFFFLLVFVINCLQHIIS